MRSILTAATAVLAVGLVPGPAAQRPETPRERPNIIYIYADDLGYGDTGPYGQEKIRTPTLDRMAAEGLRFTHHYASSPVCASSRAMLLTGLHAGHAYIRSNYELGGFTDETEGGQMPLPSGTVTIGHVLKHAGYRTAAIGKWGLGMHDNTGDPNQQGFDLFYGYLDQKQAHNYYPTHLWENGRQVPLDNEHFPSHQKLARAPADLAAYDQYQGSDYSPELMTRRAVRFIEEHRDRPFFLYLAYTIPHVALQAPDAFVQPYGDEFDDRPYLGQDGYLPNPHPRATYAAMVTALDSYVGRVLDQLRTLGLDERTLVMFSSDNGPASNGGSDRAFFGSSGGLRGGKTDLYEGGIRVPFIARWPGKVPAGRESDLVSAQYDLMATLADLTGEQPPPNDGLSMLPTLLGRPDDQEAHPFLYFEYPARGGQLAVRMGRWKGVKRDMKANPDAPWELYDLLADPAESTDLAAKFPGILSQLDGIVKREHRRAHIREWEFIDDRIPRTEQP